jgi:excisionase family DNA binding protein
VSDEQSNPVLEDLLRVSAVARRLSVSRSNVYQIMDRGDLPYVKIGKCRRVRPEDLARLIEEGTVRK